MSDLSQWIPSIKKENKKQQLFEKIINKEKVESSEQCEHCESRAHYVIDDIQLCLPCFEEYQNTRKGGMSFRWEWLSEYRRKKDEKTNS